MLVRKAVRWPQVEVLLGTLGLLVAFGTGLDRRADAMDALRPLWPVVGFLVAVLVVAHCCGAAGLFDALGRRVARARRRDAVVALGFVAAALTTALLNLDATVVLLTPVLVATATNARVPATPVAWVCLRLANSASMLFSVSNLTNLLAASHLGIGFVEFAARAWPVWVVVLVLEWLTLRIWFGRTLRVAAPRADAPGPPGRIPRFPLAVVGLMLGGFVIGSWLSIAPAWPAAVAATALGARALATRQVGASALVGAANLPLAYLVLCWGLAVSRIAHTETGREWALRLPDGSSAMSLVALALVAMVAANLINNLPAALVLIPLVAPAGTTPVMALLIGLNVGANLTYVGSLANVLWLRTVGPHRPSARRFHLISLTTTPVIVVCAALTLAGWSAWLG